MVKFLRALAAVFAAGCGALLATPGAAQTSQFEPLRCDSAEVAKSVIDAVANSPLGHTRGLRVLKVQDAVEPTYNPAPKPNLRYCTAKFHTNAGMRDASFTIKSLDGSRIQISVTIY
jgi:hypothetical protein